MRHRIPTFGDQLPPKVTITPHPTAQITTTAKPTAEVFTPLEKSQQIQQAFINNKFLKRSSLVENTKSPNDKDLYYGAKALYTLLEYKKAQDFIEQAIQKNNIDVYRSEYAKIFFISRKSIRSQSMLKNIQSEQEKAYIQMIISLANEDHQGAKKNAQILKNSEYTTG